MKLAQLFVLISEKTPDLIKNLSSKLKRMNLVMK